MTTTTTGDDLDYYRAMLRRGAPRTGAEELAWLRFMAQLLVELGRLAPTFTMALAAEHRDVRVVSRYFEEGGHEAAMEAGLPMCAGFILHYLQQPAAAGLKDLAKAELFARQLEGHLRLPEQRLSRDLGVRREHGVHFIRVQTDVVSELERLRGFASMAYAQAAQALWFLRQEPVYPVSRPELQPGLLVFKKDSAEVTLSFIPLSAVVRGGAS